MNQSSPSGTTIIVSDPIDSRKFWIIIQIIEGCKKQEPRSQKMLYERFYGYALKIAFRYVYRYDMAVNVTNDGFVKVFRHIERFRYEEEEFPERLSDGMDETDCDQYIHR